MNWTKHSKLLSPLRMEIGVDDLGFYFVKIINDGMYPVPVKWEPSDQRKNGQ